MHSTLEGLTNPSSSTTFSVHNNNHSQVRDHSSHPAVSSQNNHVKMQHNSDGHHHAAQLQSSRPVLSTTDDKKTRNWKLLQDPQLSKNVQQKVYRMEGIVAGKETIFPSVTTVVDPRRRTWTSSRVDSMDLIFPKFKIDCNYIGTPPPIEVSISNLNDNINEDFLQDMVKKFGVTEDLVIFRHPKTKKHLSLAKMTFETPKSAKACVEKLNATSVMGKVISVFLDPFGKQVQKLFDSAVNPPPVVQIPVVLNNTANVIPNPVLSMMVDNSSSTGMPSSAVLLSSHRSLEVSSTEVTSHQPLDHRRSSQYHHYARSLSFQTDQSQHHSSWSSGKGILRQESKDGSSVRESLDSRIESLFKLNHAQPTTSSVSHHVNHSSFGDGGGFTGSAPLDPADFHHYHQGHKLLGKFNQLSVSSRDRHGNYRSSSRSERRRRRRRRPKSPPSPFKSRDDFIKSVRLTRATELGIDVEEYDSRDDDHAYEEVNDDGDATPLRDEPSGRGRRDDRRSRRGYGRDSSASSSSSLELERDKSRGKSSNVHHPMYPSAEVQRMAAMGIWKPGMGSNTNQNHEAHHHHSVDSRSGHYRDYSRYYNEFTNYKHGSREDHSDRNAYGQASRDRNDREDRHGRHSSQGHHHHHWKQEESRHRTKEEREKPLISEVVDHVVNELKEIIKRDIKKKMIESTGFKSYESWWDENESKNKMIKNKSDTLSSNAISSSFSNTNNMTANIFAACPGLNISSIQKSLIPSMMNSRVAAPTQESTSFAGLGLGLGRLIPKMPSFRRKFKAPSPVPEDDWGNDDEVSRGSGPSSRVKIEDEDNNKDDNTGQVVQKNRSAAVIDSSDSEDDDQGHVHKNRDVKKKGGSVDSDSDVSSSRHSSDEDRGSSGDSLKGSSSSSSSDEPSESSDDDSDVEKRKRSKKKSPVKKSKPRIVDSSDSEVERSEVEDEADTFQEDRTSVHGEDDDSQTAMSETREEPDDKLAAEALMTLAGFSEGKSTADEGSQEEERAYSSETDSAPELDQLDKEFTRPVTAVDYDHCYAMPKKPITVTQQALPPSSLDTTIDDVVKGVFKKTKSSDNKFDHGYSRDENNRKMSNKIPKKPVNRMIEEDQEVEAASALPRVRPVASEWRRAKDKKPTTKASSVDSLSPFYDTRSPTRMPTPKPIFQKRSVVQEMDILYAFLKEGIDEEDIECLKRSYDKMLNEETAHAWLHDTHWVDHPATLIPNPEVPSTANKKRRKETEVRIHSTGCARSEGYYKMDEKEKRQHSHVSNIRADEAEMEAKVLRARGAIVQTSTREARSNQRRLLATVDAAWSDLLKFNQLQVSLFVGCFFRYDLTLIFDKTVPKEAVEVCSQ